jgi:hypothetical protein
MIARLIRRLLGIKSPSATEAAEMREAMRRLECNLRACGYERRS